MTANLMQGWNSSLQSMKQLDALIYYYGSLDSFQQCSGWRQSWPSQRNFNMYAAFKSSLPRTTTLRRSRNLSLGLAYRQCYPGIRAQAELPVSQLEVH